MSMITQRGEIVNMVVTITAHHIYKYPLEIVVTTHLAKYPTEKDCNVVRVDTVKKSYDAKSGIEYWQRVAVCKNVLPWFLRKFKTLDVDHILMEEECFYDVRGRYFRCVCNSVTWAQYAYATEESTFKPHMDNDKWTVFEQSGSVSIRGFGSFGRVLEMFARGFLIQGARRSRAIMEDILQERTNSIIAPRQRQSPDLST